MEIRIQVIVDNDERTRRDIARWGRTSLASETLGLQLDEARTLYQPEIHLLSATRNGSPKAALRSCFAR
jgi:hypothetical protein